MDYNPRGRKELDRTERLHVHFHFQYTVYLLFSDILIIIVAVILRLLVFGPGILTRVISRQFFSELPNFHCVIFIITDIKFV